jgi:hypothetical protein
MGVRPLPPATNFTSGPTSETASSLFGINLTQHDDTEVDSQRLDAA